MSRERHGGFVEQPRPGRVVARPAARSPLRPQRGRTHGAAARPASREPGQALRPQVVARTRAVRASPAARGWTVEAVREAPRDAALAARAVSRVVAETRSRDRKSTRLNS